MAIRLKAVFPGKRMTEWQQARVDDAGVESIDQLVQDIRNKGTFWIPMKILDQGTEATITYLNSKTDSLVSTVIAQTYNK